MVRKGGLALLACLVVAGCTVGGVGQAGTTPIESHPPDVIPTAPTSAAVYPGAALGPAPSACSRPALQSINPNVGLGIGEAPAFAVGAWDSAGVRHAQRATQIQYGEEVKVLWVISPQTNQLITLRGASVNTGSPLYFEIGNASPASAPTLDPTAAPQSDGGWTYFPSYLDIPAADCYYIEASWPGGSWRIEFPAGD